MMQYDISKWPIYNIHLLPIISYLYISYVHLFSIIIYLLIIIYIGRQYLLVMVKTNKSKTKDLSIRQPRQYNKYHLVIRKQDKEGKKIKEIVGNFGLRKYT